MQTVSTTCTAPAGLETMLLQITAALTGHDLGKITAGDLCHVESTISHSFPGTSQELTASGLTGVIQHLLTHSRYRQLIGGDTPTQMAATESWVKAAEQKLVPVVRNGKKEPFVLAEIDSFCQVVAHSLSHNKQSWLMGSHATIADAVVATALAVCLQQVCLDLKPPENVCTWCNVSLELLMKCCGSLPSMRAVCQQLSSYYQQPTKTPSRGKKQQKQGGKKGKKQQPKKSKQPKQGGNKRGGQLVALQCSKNENFDKWYTDVIVVSELTSDYDVSGCYILRPWSYKMWELIQIWLNGKIRNEMGAENAYFPMFVSKERLGPGFAPEVAWVTKSGSGDLARPIAIRPTSETIMYPAYSEWIKSHRDLPLKLNQWSNAVRLESKNPTPFLRTREFLWQEGHTAHATWEEADETVMQALELYRRVYEELLAVPIIAGHKTEKEKFVGGSRTRTTTVQAYIPGSGRAVQGATSHNLGQNFAKMFDITHQTNKGESEHVWQTSWGLSTRAIGVTVMVHGDDKGLVLPPQVAPLQVVIVPIIHKDFTTEQANGYCSAIIDDIKAAGIRVKYDDRDLYSPGWKFKHWEQKGVPIRIEVGPRDVQNKSALVAIRHSGVKENVPVGEGMSEWLLTKLKEIHSGMFVKALADRDAHLVRVTEWKDFVPNLEKNNLVLTPWCGGEHQDYWEEWVKDKSREESLKARGEEGEDNNTATSVAAKTLCIPFDQPELLPGTNCLASGLSATCWVLWGRSYELLGERPIDCSTERDHGTRGTVFYSSW